MIWIGCLVLAVLCALLAVQQLLIARQLGRRIDGAIFEGPARLELFGHVTHIGWVRQGPERIDVLTIEGEALQCDTRARYRLTPLTWKEFVAECLQWRDEGDRLVEREIAARAKTEERRAALRIAIGDAIERLSSQSPGEAKFILDMACEKDGEHDAPPF